MITREMTSALESFATLPRERQEEVVEKIQAQRGVTRSFRLLHTLKAFVKEVANASQQEEV